jgi:hypothetical protein
MVLYLYPLPYLAEAYLRFDGPQWTVKNAGNILAELLLGVSGDLCQVIRSGLRLLLSVDTTSKKRTRPKSFLRKTRKHCILGNLSDHNLGHKYSNLWLCPRLCPRKCRLCPSKETFLRTQPPLSRATTLDTVYFLTNRSSSCPL